MSAVVQLSCGLLRHRVYRDERAMRLLVHLMLLIAEEEAADNAGEQREAGVLVRSMGDLAIGLRWHRSRVVRAIEALKAADAVRTGPAIGGTRFKCLYYARPELQPPAPKPKKRAPAPSREARDQRESRFRAASEAVWVADPARLPSELRAEFVAYWTEANATGVMRFEAQPFFDHARRMDTWRRNAEAKGFKPGAASRDDAAKGRWNPRA